MTEQTTAERLLATIGMNYRIIQHGDTRIADHSKAANIIAAEIDRLTAERDEARALAKRDSDSCAAMLEKRDTEILAFKVEAYDAKVQLINASQRCDDLTRERDGLKAALAASWPNLSAQLSEARAEMERLSAQLADVDGTVDALTEQYSILAEERNGLRAQLVDCQKALVSAYGLGKP